MTEGNATKRSMVDGRIFATSTKRALVELVLGVSVFGRARTHAPLLVRRVHRIFRIV